MTAQSSPRHSLKFALAQTYTLIAPDSLAGVGIKDAHNVLEHLANSPVSLSNVVIILDTLKKFVPVLDKGEGKAFFNLLRKITAKGATICLLSHTNKYLTKDGDLIYEGRGGTGSGMSSGEFWSVRLAERANAWSVALAGATQASRGLY